MRPWQQIQGGRGNRENGGVRSDESPCHFLTVTSEIEALPWSIHSQYLILVFHESSPTTREVLVKSTTILVLIQKQYLVVSKRYYFQWLSKKSHRGQVLEVWKAPDALIFLSSPPISGLKYISAAQPFESQNVGVIFGCRGENGCDSRNHTHFWPFSHPLTFLV